MTRASLRKLTLLTICGSLPIFPTASATANTNPQNQESAKPSKLSHLIAPVEEDSAAVFSPSVQPDDLVDGDKGDKGEFASSSPPSPLFPTPHSPLSQDVSEEIHIPSTSMSETQIKSNASITADEVRIVSPQGGVITEDKTNLVVEYHSSAEVTVKVNGKLIDASIVTQVEKDAAQQNTQVWYNVPLSEGENTITAQAATGKPVSVKLTVKQRKAKISIAPTGDRQLPADGRSTIELNGKIIDEDGEIIPKNFTVTLTASAGKFIGADQDKDASGFQVLARNGIFTATLQSTLEAQRVEIRAAVDALEDKETRRQGDTERRGQGGLGGLGGLGSEFSPLSPLSSPPPPLPLSSSPLEAYTDVEFITYLRPSLATGSVNLRIGAGGTNYWGSYRDFLNPKKQGTEVDLNAAVFATGKVGDWLFTGAFNSDRSLNQDCNGDNRLFGSIQSCEKQYPVYGDSSTVTSTAPSTDSVYARFERTSPVPGAEPDYFMWGDYNTTELARTSQLYTATTRQLHGFKGNYNFGNLQLTALYANNIEGFQRDTITPTGLSGTYFLSRRLVTAGSENVFLESEEINRPGTVVERKPLLRGADYDIDYDRGTLNFHRPMFATELNPFGSTLVKRIVVTYQNDGGEDANLYAGRLQYNFRGEAGNTTPFIAGSYLRENQGAQNFQLYGFDFFAPLGKNGQIVGEYARSNHNSLTFGDVSGSAYRLEGFGNFSDRIQGKAYYRSLTENFSNNATSSFTPGQTRYGASAIAKLTDSTSFNLGYDREDNFGIAPATRTQFFDLFNPQPQPTPGSRVDNKLTTIRAGIQQKLGASELGIEYVNRSREDKISNQFDGNASQIVSHLNVPLSNALTFRAQNELNLGDSDVLYPNRTTLGLDWALYPGVTMRLAHQFYDGGLLKGNSITSLDTILDHKLSENTNITGRYSILSGVEGLSDQGAVGLNHRIRLAPGLKLNLGYEHIFNNLFTPTAAGARFAQPYAVGQSASYEGLFSGDAYNVGLEYTDNPNFQAGAQFEYRNGSGGSNTVISANVAGKITPALTALVRYHQAGGANQLLEGLGDTANLKVGLAYRDPNNDNFNALLRYEYRQNPSTIPDNLLNGSGNNSIDHLFAAEAIYAPNWQWEFYGKYAYRNSTGYLANNFTNSSSVHLAQLRASYQLGYRTDLAVEGRWIGQPEQGYNEFGVALEGGYYFTPDLRIGLGYAFGGIDDRDFTGYRSNGGPYLNISFKVNELFGGFGRQKVVPRQQQESEVKTMKKRGKGERGFLRNPFPLLGDREV
ncbi:MAG: hypothetical protein ACR2LR_03000 [Hassallia sp.]